jgi:competence protein ComGC
MKKLLLATIIGFTGLFGFGDSQNTKIDANSIRDSGDNSLIITFKAQSPDLMVIKHEIEYNSNEFEIDDINANSYFHLEKAETSNGDKRTLTLLLDSENSFNSIEYMELKLRPKDDVKTGTLTVNNIEVANTNHKIVKAAGSVLTVQVDTDNYKLYKEEILMQNPIVKYIRSHKKIVLIICGIVLLLIIINNIRRKQKNLQNKKKKYFTDMKTPEQQIEEISNEEGIELIQKVESEEKDNPISDDVFKGKYEVFILLLLVGSLFGVTKVLAINENTQSIRETIVNKKTYTQKCDLNRDNKVNIIDLVYALESKDTVNKGDINFK